MNQEQLQHAARVFTATAVDFWTEPRVRHTMRCQEAQQFGGVYDEKRSPAGSCVCSELERLHDDWKALRVVVGYASEAALPVTGSTAHFNLCENALLSMARAKAALDDLHERIMGAVSIEHGDDVTFCRICRQEDGP